MKMDNDSLRAYLGAIAFRFSYLAKNLESEFAEFDAGHGVRKPIEIIRHMSELINFCMSQYKTVESRDLEQLDWRGEKERFLALVKEFDRAIVNGTSFNNDLMQAEKMWQGPLADIMTHIGQLVMLRRLWGSPVEKISYWQAPVFDFSKL